MKYFYNNKKGAGKKELKFFIQSLVCYLGELRHRQWAWNEKHMEKLLWSILCENNPFRFKKHGSQKKNRSVSQKRSG